jgi:hypothetical protein
VSWLFRPDQWPTTPQGWIDRASRWPTTPRQWFALVDEISRSPTRVLVDLVESVSAGLVGRRIDLKTATETITLALTEVTCSHDNPPVAMGALSPGRDIEGIETVTVTATDVVWPRGRVDDLRVAAHDVRLETGIVTRIRTSPVEMEGRIGQATVDEWVRWTAERGGVDLHRVELCRPGTVRVWPRPWLSAEVDVVLDGDEVVLPVQRVQAWGVTVPFVRKRLEERRVPIPPLAQGLRITGIDVTADEIVAEGRIEQLREPVWLDQVIRAASTVGSHVVLNLRPPAGAGRSGRT